MTPTLETVKPGFTAPVFDAQSVFRSVLDAMAHPGRINGLPVTVDPPAGLDPATAAVALTLFDFETPLWLDPAIQSDAVDSYLRFHCGSPVVTQPQEASFAIVTTGQDMPRPTSFSIGTDQYPDTSTTLVIQTQDLTAPGPIRLSGPGIRGTAAISIDGLPDWFWGDWAINHGCYPTGVDLIFTSGMRTLCLPRSIKAER